MHQRFALGSAGLAAGVAIAIASTASALDTPSNVAGEQADPASVCARAGFLGIGTCLLEPSAKCEWNEELDRYTFQLPTQAQWTDLVRDYNAPHAADSTVHDYLVGETDEVWPHQYALLSEMWGPQTGHKSPVSQIAQLVEGAPDEQGRSNGFGVWLSAQRESIYNLGTGFGWRDKWLIRNVAGDFLEQEYANLYTGGSQWYCYGQGVFAAGGEGSRLHPDDYESIGHCKELTEDKYAYIDDKRCWYPKDYCSGQDDCVFHGGATVGKNDDENWALYMGCLGLRPNYPSNFHRSYFCNGDHTCTGDLAPPTGFPLALVVTAELPADDPQMYHWSEREMLNWTQALSVDESPEEIE